MPKNKIAKGIREIKAGKTIMLLLTLQHFLTNRKQL
jgi:hypothetical protein